MWYVQGNKRHIYTLTITPAQTYQAGLAALESFVLPTMCVLMEKKSHLLRLCEVILKSKVPKVNVPEFSSVVVSFCCSSDWLVFSAEVVELLLKLCVVVGVEADSTDVKEIKRDTKEILMREIKCSFS